MHRRISIPMIRTMLSVATWLSESAAAVMTAIFVLRLIRVAFPDVLRAACRLVDILLREVSHGYGCQEGESQEFDVPAVGWFGKGRGQNGLPLELPCARRPWVRRCFPVRGA